MITIDKLQILKMHRALIQSLNGIQGLRDISALERAINNSFSNVIINQIHVSDIQKIARLTYNISKFKPFIESNTAVAIFCMLLLLEINNIFIYYKENEIIELGKSLTYCKIKYNDLVDWIEKHLV